MHASHVAILVLAASAASTALSAPLAYVVAPLNLAISADSLVGLAELPVCPPPLMLLPAMAPHLPHATPGSLVETSRISRISSTSALMTPSPHCTDAMSAPPSWMPAASSTMPSTQFSSCSTVIFSVVTSATSSSRSPPTVARACFPGLLAPWNFMISSTRFTT